MMKNKITLENLEDSFFNKLASAIKADFPTKNSALVAVSTLSMIWHKYQITDYMKTFEIDKTTFKKYFKKNIDVSVIREHMFYKEFKSEAAEIYDNDFNSTFKFASEAIKSSENLEPIKQDVVIALLQIVRDRILKTDPTILETDITTDEYFTYLDKIFFKK